MSKHTKLIGISTILFPILLLIGFLLHPDFSSFEITTTAHQLIDKFYKQPMFHIGHLIVFFAVFFIILNIVYLMLNMSRFNNWLFIGGILALIGCVILAGDKGALCIVLSAFDKLTPDELDQIKPALTAIVERKGLLSIFYALPLLPIGASLQLVGLLKEKQINKVNGILGITGLMLLNNPDIEIISSIGAFLMCFAYLPMGYKIITSSNKK